MRWCCLERVGPICAWSGLPVSIASEAKDLFLAATKCIVDNGGRASFWHDCRIPGQSTRDIVNFLFPFIHALGYKTRTVVEGLADNK